MTIDYDRVLLLLRVVEKSRNYPNLKFLHDDALKELEAVALAEPPPQAILPGVMTSFKPPTRAEV